MTQVFYADLSAPCAHSNGATSYGSPMPFRLTSFAKVTACPIDGFPDVRLTCYATGDADTYWTIPACTRRRGRYVSGYLTCNESGPTFHPHAKYRALFDPSTGTKPAAPRSIDAADNLKR